MSIQSLYFLIPLAITIYWSTSSSCSCVSSFRSFNIFSRLVEFPPSGFFFLLLLCSSIARYLVLQISTVYIHGELPEPGKPRVDKRAETFRDANGTSSCYTRFSHFVRCTWTVRRERRILAFDTMDQPVGKWGWPELCQFPLTANIYQRFARYARDYELIAISATQTI